MRRSSAPFAAEASGTEHRNIAHGQLGFAARAASRDGLRLGAAARLPAQGVLALGHIENDRWWKRVARFE